MFRQNYNPKRAHPLVLSKVQQSCSGRQGTKEHLDSLAAGSTPGPVRIRRAEQKGWQARALWAEHEPVHAWRGSGLSWETGRAACHAQTRHPTWEEPRFPLSGSPPSEGRV